MKRKLGIISFGICVAPLLMGFTSFNDYFVEKTDQVTVSFTDLGDVSYAYKKYTAEAENKTDHYITLSMFSFEGGYYDFQQLNHPFYRQDYLFSPNEKCDFFLVVPNSADMNSYEKTANMYLDEVTDGSIDGTFTLKDLRLSSQNFRRLAIECSEANLSNNFEYAYCVYLTYQGSEYNTITYKDQNGQIYIDVSLNTDVNDIKVNRIQAFRIGQKYDEEEPRHRHINFRILGLLFLGLLFFIMFYVGIFALLFKFLVKCTKK